MYDPYPIPHSLTAEDCGFQPADIVFINDESGSVGASNFQKTLLFIETVVNGFNIGPFDAQIGLITFSSATRLQFDLNTYSNKEVRVSSCRPGVMNRSYR